MSKRYYEPKGTRFYDSGSGREMMLVLDNEPRVEIRGWLLYRHPEGQWVTLRKATDADIDAISQAVIEDHHAH